MSEAAKEQIKSEAHKAIRCLYIAVDETVARGVQDKVWAYFDYLERELFSKTNLLKELQLQLTPASFVCREEYEAVHRELNNSLTP